MTEKQRFEITEEELSELLKACRPTPVMYGPGGVSLFGTPQENANAVWRRLGAKYGFQWDSCTPAEAGNQRAFMAYPIPVMTEKEKAHRAELAAKMEREAQAAEVAAYFNRCEHHDWLYDYSDDHRVWSAGHAARGRLRNEADADPVKKSIFEAWRNHVFSGENFGCPKVPKPEIATYTSKETLPEGAK